MNGEKCRCRGRGLRKKETRRRVCNRIHIETEGTLTFFLCEHRCEESVSANETRKIEIGRLTSKHTFSLKHAETTWLTIFFSRRIQPEEET